MFYGDLDGSSVTLRNSTQPNLPLMVKILPMQELTMASRRTHTLTNKSITIGSQGKEEEREVCRHGHSPQ